MILIAQSESMLLLQRARRASRPRPERAPLRVDTTQLDGVSYARNSQHVCRYAVVDAVRVREVNDVFKGLAQDELKLHIHSGFFPEISLAVLHPLKVRSGNAAGVGKNVWNDEDFFVGKNFICGRRGWTICAFADNLCLDACRVLAGDHVFSGRGDEDFAVGKKELTGIGGVSARKTDNRFVAIAMLQQSVNVDAGTIEQAAIVFSDANDLVACVLHELGRVGADVAKALNNHARGLTAHFKFAKSFIAVDHHAAAGGFAPST